MPRLTSRPSPRALENLQRRLRDVFSKLGSIREQLEEWRGAAEKIETWAKDIEQADQLIERVDASMRLILEGSTREQIDDEEYSF